MINGLRNTMRSIRQAGRGGSGLRRAVVLSEWAARAAEEHVIDARYRRLGLDTRQADPTVPDATAELRRYVATEWSVLRQILPRGSLGPDDVLLDYGSGKGRVALWTASRFPLRRIVGVEHDPRYVSVASENLRRWRGPRRCQDVTFICADARDYDVPDDVTAVFMYNPFMGAVFDQAIARLDQSLQRRPRALRLYYYIPVMHTALVRAGFTLESSRRHERYAWAVYRIG